MPHLNVNGARLWCDTMGQGEPLLLHHGYAASRDNWLPVAERLAASCKVVLMECRGCGASENTEKGYNLAQYALDAVELMKQLGHTKFSFGGHSMGGGVGMQIAFDHGDKLNKLILMASVGSKGLIGDSFRANVEDRLAARKRKDKDFFMKEQMSERFRPEVQTEEWFNLRVHHLMNVVSDGHLVDSMTSLQNMGFEEKLAAVNHHTLVMSGGVDPLLKTNLQDFARLPNASLQVFFRAAHEIAIHEPEGVAETIKSFMRHGALSAKTLKNKTLKTAP